MAQETQTGVLHQSRGLGCGQMGGRVKRERIYDICIAIADSC